MLFSSKKALLLNLVYFPRFGMFYKEKSGNAVSKQEVKATAD
jgi:hypothetical protein